MSKTVDYLMNKYGLNNIQTGGTNNIISKNVDPIIKIMNSNLEIFKSDPKIIDQKLDNLKTNLIQSKIMKPDNEFKNEKLEKLIIKASIYLKKKSERIISKSNQVCNLDPTIQFGGAFSDNSDVWWAGFISGLDDNDYEEESEMSCIGMLCALGFTLGVIIISPEAVQEFLNGQLCAESYGLMCN